MDKEICIETIHGTIPREAYSYTAAGNVDGKMALVLVFNAGNDEEYLRKTLQMPENETFCYAIRFYMKVGV